MPTVICSNREQVTLIELSPHVDTYFIPTRLIVIIDVFSPTDISHELVRCQVVRLESSVRVNDYKIWMMDNAHGLPYTLDIIERR
jgi:hypothetical protein